MFSMGGKKCPFPSMEGDMGWLPPYVRHKGETVRMWCHLCILPPDRLTRRVFDWDYRQAQLGMNTRNAGAILHDCGLEALKNTRLLTSSKKWVVDTAITKLTDIFELQWKVEIKNLPKLRTYRELKSTFTCENYVKILRAREAAYLDYASECFLWPSRQAVKNVENRKASESSLPTTRRRD